MKLRRTQFTDSLKFDGAQQIAALRTRGMCGEKAASPPAERGAITEEDPFKRTRRRLQ